MEEIYCESLSVWRDWLEKNHACSKGIWLVFYKKESGKPTLDYEESVEEALCFGWIDSIIKKIDEVSYVRKFTPRNDRSPWSQTNKKRVEKLIREMRMTAAGWAKVQIAQQNGEWDKPPQPRIQFEMPEELQEALIQNSHAQKFFASLTRTDQKQFITWIAVAKRPETRQKRVHEVVELLEKGQKLGLK